MHIVAVLLPFFVVLFMGMALFCVFYGLIVSRRSGVKSQKIMRLRLISQGLALACFLLSLVVLSGTP